MRRVSRVLPWLGLRLLPVVATAALSACVVPAVHGPYYQPIYPQAERVGTPTLKSAAAPLAAPFMKQDAGSPSSASAAPVPLEDVWIAGTPGHRLRFRHGACFMEARAAQVGAEFVFRWSIEKTTGCDQAVTMDPPPVTLEDLSDGRVFKPAVYTRSLLTDEPEWPTDQPVDLPRLIEGFKTVPAPEQRYLVSLSFVRYFDTPLPERITLEVPPLRLGGQRIVPPPLNLRRNKEPMSRFSHYRPDTAAEAGTDPADGHYSKWAEVPDAMSMASLVWGWADGKKWGDEHGSGVRGVIRFYVHSGAAIQLEQPTLTWSADDGTPATILPITRWQLGEYSTTRLDDRLRGVWLGRRSEPFDDKWVTHEVRIPGYAPKQIKVTLPSITVDGQPWNIQPIVFELRHGSIELIDAM